MSIRTIITTVIVLSLNLLMISSIPGDNDGIKRLFKHVGEYSKSNLKNKPAN